SMMYIRVLDGVIRKGQKILMMATGGLHEVEEVGRFQIRPVPTEALCAGEVGYLFAGIKDLSEIKIGDTLTDPARPTAKAHPGYKDLKPVVFAGLYPISNTDYEVLSQALGKLQLNDPSFQYFPETSMALGFVYRCGFLGLLHMDIIRERLEREFGLSLITTSPSVVYLVTGEDGEPREIDNPAKLPDAGKIRGIAEPFIHATVICPAEYVGPAMALCQDRRGVFLDMRYITTTRVILSYELPLAEIVLDFYDALKSVSRGYASFDYEPVGYRTSDLVRLDILLNQEPVDALSFIVHRDKAEYQGRRLVERLREVIPRQMFDVPIQARINSRVVARETVKAIRKDVLAKCYGGDITRKMKLLERQKEGKARLKQIGTVEIPKEAFMAVLRVGKESH
ncbi:MAG: translation elongation factor 4, partial [bacterium]